MGIGFESISCVGDLVDYLEDMGERLKNSQYVCTYMSLSKLERIIKERKYFLSSPNRMNDKYEVEQYPQLKKPGVFYACFMKSESESIAMWSMYAQPWELGVRISIPVKIFSKWVKEIKQVYYKRDEEITKVENFKIYYGDVLYVDSSSDIVKRNPKKNEHIMKFYRDKGLSGFVKDVAWQYEHECRIHVDVDGLNAPGVLIDVPQYVFDNMIVMMGPRCNDKHVQNKIGEITNNTFKIQHSMFLDRLSWIYCDECKKLRKRKFMRKRMKKIKEPPDICISELFDSN